MRKSLLLPVKRVVMGGLLPSCLLLVLLLCVTGHLSAQAPRMLDKRIDFKIVNGTLIEALQKVRSVSGVHISFNEEELNRQSRITLDLSNETTRKILEKILERTNLQYIEGNDGSLLITPRKNKKDPVKGSLWFFLSGQVTDKKGTPLPNASIQVVGDKIGASTDNKGIFNILATVNVKIRVSYLGMKSSESLIKSDEFVKIELDTAPAVMTEYVITGYQTIDKRMQASSSYTLSADKLIQPGTTSIDQMLQGKVPGLIVVNSSGSPSATPTIRIRGTSTILGNASPLWVVDGIIKEDPVNLSPLQVNKALQDAQSANFNIVGNSIAGLNPYDIESLTFLKDASATAIYGVRAANGVIVVKTKRGKSGPLSISYNVTAGLTSRPNYQSLSLMDSKQRIDVSKEIAQDGVYFDNVPQFTSYEGLLQLLNTRAITQEQFNTQVGQLETMNTDWFKLLASNAFNHSHSLSFSGGLGKSTFYSSFSFADARGAFNGDNEKRYTFMTSLMVPVNKHADLNISLNGYYRTANGFFQVNPSDYALQTSRAISADSPYATNISVTPNLTAPQTLHYSIFNELSQTGNTTSTQDVTAKIGLTYRLLPGLSLNSSFSGDVSHNRSFSYASDHSYFISVIRGYDFGAVANGSYGQINSALPFGGLAYPSNTDNLSYTLTSNLNYDLGLFHGRDQFNMMVGQEISSVKTDGFSSQELGYYPDRGNTYYSDYYNVGGGAGINTNYKHYAITTDQINNKLSWMAVASYRLNKKYTLNANIRTDGSNRFGQYANQRFLPNWSIAGRWDIGDEPWLKKSNLLSGLSLRASYGSAGNVVSEVSPNLIASYPTSPVDLASNEYVLNLKSLPYPDLRWEKTYSYNLGVDMNLFNGRVNLTVDMYDKKSTNLLVGVNIPEEYGINQMYENYGEMENYGWDASLRIMPVRTRNFDWEQTFIFSQNHNSVVRSDLPYTFNDYLTGNAIVTGKPLNSFYSFAFSGLDPKYGIPTYNNLKNTPAHVTDPSQYLSYSGSSTPLIQTSTSTNLRYKSFSLTANFVVSVGRKKRLNPDYYWMRQTGGAPFPTVNLPKELAGRWRKPGDEKSTNIPSFSNWYAETGPVFLPNTTADAGTYGVSMSPYAMYDLSTERVVDASYLRCNSLMISYTIPNVFLQAYHIKGANIGANITNLFLIENSRFHGQDPEAGNTGTGVLPITRSYNLNLNLSF